MLTRAKRAFTLLELIVVIVILGILAALAIPTFASVISKSENQGAKTSAEAVARNAVALAAFDNSAPTAAHVVAAVAETAGVYITGTAGDDTVYGTADDLTGAAAAAVITDLNAVSLRVGDGSAAKTALVNMPDDKNGAAVVTVS